MEIIKWRMIAIISTIIIITRVKVIDKLNLKLGNPTRKNIMFLDVT